MKIVATIAGIVAIVANVASASANTGTPVEGCVVGVAELTSPRYDPGYPGAQRGPMAKMIPMTMYVNVPC